MSAMCQAPYVHSFSTIRESIIIHFFQQMRTLGFREVRWLREAQQIAQCHLLSVQNVVFSAKFYLIIKPAHILLFIQPLIHFLFFFRKNSRPFDKENLTKHGVSGGKNDK